METKFEADKKSYQEEFQEKLDILTVDNASALSMIFSWSVRSELLRGNKEQVGLLLNQFVKTENVKSVLFINKENIIELSTDKKREGNTYKEVAKLANAKGEIENNMVIIPIYGINETLGYVEVNFEDLPSTK